MTQVTNTFEGGTDGATITTGNSGGVSGDAFQNVLTPATFDGTHVYTGSLAAKMGGPISVLGYNSTSPLGALREVHNNLFVYLPTTADPSSYFQLIAISEEPDGEGQYSGGETNVSPWYHTVGIQSAVAEFQTSSPIIPFDAWFRLVSHFRTESEAGAQDGYVSCKIYVTDLVGSPDEVLELTDVTTGSNPYTIYEIGASPVTGEFQWVDGIHWYSEMGGLLSTVATLDHSLLSGIRDHHDETHTLLSHPGGFVYKTGVAVTITDSDITAIGQVATDGMVAVTYDTMSTVTLLWTRLNGTWLAVEAT